MLDLLFSFIYLFEEEEGGEAEVDCFGWMGG